MKFSKSLTEFTIKTKESMDRAYEQIAVELYNRIVNNTPIDTGMARANWKIAAGTMDSSTSESTHYKNIDSLPGLKVGVNEAWISNHLHYIYSLENGHSQQAPAGMVMVSIEELKMWVRSKFGGA